MPAPRVLLSKELQNLIGAEEWELSEEEWELSEPEEIVLWAIIARLENNMPKTEGRPMTATEVSELSRTIRDNALDQFAAGLRNCGIDDEAIQKARAECITQNSDEPFLALFKSAISNLKG